MENHAGDWQVWHWIEGIRLGGDLAKSGIPKVRKTISLFYLQCDLGFTLLMKTATARLPQVTTTYFRLDLVGNAALDSNETCKFRWR